MHRSVSALRPEGDVSAAFIVPPESVQVEQSEDGCTLVMKGDVPLQSFGK